MRTLSHPKNLGFTIVELLVVIVIIGILASITVVAYNGIQGRARDSVRKNDLGSVSESLQLYFADKGNYIGDNSGCGLSGNGSGYLNAGPNLPGYPGLYPRSIIDCLKDSSLLDASTSYADPSGCKPGDGGKCGVYNTDNTVYMKATCTKNGVPVAYVLAHLESMPRQDTVIDGLCDPNSLHGYDTEGQRWGTHYGMNFYLQVQ